MPLIQAIDGPRPGKLDADADRLWLDLRREIGEAVDLGQFDPRTALRLSGRQLADWRARRLAWLAEYFESDPRVTT